MKTDVLILAGARNEGALREYSSVEHEALIQIADIPMVEYVIKACNKAEYIGNTALVGPREDIKKNVRTRPDIIIDPGDSITENIKKGLEKLAPDNYILIISSDIPLITSEVIDEFIQTCRKNEADIYYPIISKKNNKDKFPQVQRTYVHLAEGHFTGGNMVLIKPEVLFNTLDFLGKAVLNRKKPWKLSKLLGLKIVFKLLLGRLSLAEIEDRVYELIGYRGRGMIIEHPEVGFDVDKPSDLELMRKKYI